MHCSNNALIKITGELIRTDVQLLKLVLIHSSLYMPICIIHGISNSTNRDMNLLNGATLRQSITLVFSKFNIYSSIPLDTYLRGVQR